MTQNMSAPIIFVRAKQNYTLQEDKDALISKAIDRSLASFGKGFSDYIYSLLEKDYQMKRDEIPARINEFSNAIENALGEGAKFIEMKIIQSLHKDVKGFIYFPRGDDLLLAEYIESLRRLR